MPDEGLRRRKGISKVVEDLDIFEKVVENVKEEKRASSGLVSIICTTCITILVLMELKQFFYGAKHFEYRFDVDTDMETSPTLDVDMVLATPCNSLQVTSSADQASGIIGMFQPSIKKDPTRFEFTDEEQMYWTVLRHAHAQMNEQGLRGLEELQYVDDDIESNLEHLADEKQKEEAAHIAEERKTKKRGRGGNGQVVLMMGNGMGMFQVVASNGVDEGTACRVHGKFPVRKGGEERIVISINSGIGEIFMHMDGTQQKGNISHRIEKFNFGPRIGGLVAPLAGAEQISESGQDIYRYFIKIVPTKIYRGLFSGYLTTYQYSVTFLKKKLKDGEHSHGGILFEYEFSPTVIEVREVVTSYFEVFIRLCSIIGGVFATSRVINMIIVFIVSIISSQRIVPAPVDNSVKASLMDSSIRVH